MLLEAGDMCKIKSPTVHVSAKKRVRRFRKNGYDDAAASIGKVEPGCEIFGFTKGQFSFIDVIEYLLTQTGAADVSLSTWTAADADLKTAYNLLQNGRIRSIRFLVDWSFASRKPEYCAALVEQFGEDSFRVSRTHAKYCVIRNDQWNITVRTSMNLNMNPRFENFEISDDRRSLILFVRSWTKRSSLALTHTNP